MGSRIYAVKQYNKSENKCKKELKALKNKKSILYSIANKPGSYHDIKKFNKTRGKDSNKTSNSSSDDSDSDSLLARDSS